MEEINDIEPETISAIGNFSIVEETSSLVFDLLLDFEDDGDIYIMNIENNGLSRITEDQGLREQQPSVIYKDGDVLIAYTAVSRYGTIPEEMRTGHIMITQITDAGKTIDTMQEGKDPCFSDDGDHLAFTVLEFDENNEYIKQYTIKIFEISSGNTDTLLSSNVILFLIGWI
jgi:Tol biopolymer transport system component